MTLLFRALLIHTLLAIRQQNWGEKIMLLVNNLFSFKVQYTLISCMRWWCKNVLTGNPALPGKPSGPCRHTTHIHTYRHMHAHMCRNTDTRRSRKAWSMIIAEQHINNKHMCSIIKQNCSQSPSNCTDDVMLTYIKLVQIFYLLHWR